MYLWVKSFHLIGMVAWFAGLLYLPRLFVYHAIADDEPGRARFRVMERKLYRGIMNPAAWFTAVCGAWLIAIHGTEWLRQAHWLHVKLLLVAGLIAYHFYLGRLVRVFAEEANRRTHVYYRWLNELPVLILVAVVLLAELKPSPLF